jgi:hypothetical protein
MFPSLEKYNPPLEKSVKLFIIKFPVKIVLSLPDKFTLPNIQIPMNKNILTQTKNFKNRAPTTGDDDDVDEDVNDGEDDVDEGDDDDDDNGVDNGDGDGDGDGDDGDDADDDEGGYGHG